MVGFPFVVTGGNKVIQTTDAGFGKHDLEFLKTFRHTCEYQLRNDLGRRHGGSAGRCGMCLTFRVPVPDLGSITDTNAGRTVEMDWDPQLFTNIPQRIPMEICDMGQPFGHLTVEVDATMTIIY